MRQAESVVLGYSSYKNRGGSSHENTAHAGGRVDTDTGKRIRVYRSNERLSRPAFGLDEPRLLNAGHLAFRALRGHWANEEVDREARAMSIGVDASGGFMVPHPLSLSIIDFARAASVPIPLFLVALHAASATGCPQRRTGER
jgi:hypothetical protein